jgi:hypothetical protein
MGGVISSVLGTSNDYRADPAQVANNYYGSTIQGGAQSALGGHDQQQDFIKLLQARASGAAGPSPAELLLKQGADAAGRQGASLAASQRGMSPALALRMGLDAQANANQGAAGQAGILRAQEQLGATNQLGGAIGQQRQQDIGLMGTAGGLQNQQNAINVQNWQDTQRINAGVAGQNAQTSGNIIGGLLGGAGSAMAMASGGLVRPMPDYFTGNGAAGDTSEGAGLAKFLGGANKQLGNAVAGLAGGGSVDSPRNDTVPAVLSPGEIVIPRSIALAEDAPEKAAAFVRAIRRRKEGAGSGYGRVIALERGTGYWRGGRA